MTLNTKFGLAAVVLGLAAGTSAHATNITIFDSVGGGGFGGGPTGQGNEDQEVEAGASTGQKWDLEAFEQNGNTLSLWGGFDFVNGEGQGNNLWGSGDIFIDVNGDAVWGDNISSRSTSNSDYKYDYVISFDRSGAELLGTYDVYSIGDTTDVLQTYDWGGTKFDWSNPFALDRDSVSADDLVASGSYSYTANSGANPLGLTGGAHNVLSVDLGFLDSAQIDGALFHFTMECGNDGMKGRGTNVPDGGMTLCLLGTVAGALGMMRRRMA